MNTSTFLSALLLATATSACMAQVGTPGGGGKDIPGGCKEEDFGLELSTAADVDGIPKGCFVLLGDLVITRSTMTDLQPLAELQAVRGSLRIEDNTALTTLRGLLDLEVEGDVIIEGNTRLADLDGLTATRRIDELVIRDNGALTDLGGLRDLDEVNGNVVIANNPALTQLNGLDALRTIDGRLEIQVNDRLATLSGLGRVTSVAAVDVSGNLALRDLSGLGLTVLRGNAGSFTLRDNTALTSLATLKLAEVDGDLDVQSNGQLGQLGAGNLRRIGGNLIVSNNPRLGSIDGLSSTLQVSRDFRITSNPLLTSVLALYQGVGATTLTVTGNPQLSTLRSGHLAQHNGRLPVRNVYGNGTNQNPDYEDHAN